eukprot:EG_transcript_39718
MTDLHANDWCDASDATLLTPAPVAPPLAGNWIGRGLFSASAAVAAVTGLLLLTPAVPLPSLYVAPTRPAPAPPALLSRAAHLSAIQVLQRFAHKKGPPLAAPAAPRRPVRRNSLAYAAEGEHGAEDEDEDLVSLRFDLETMSPSKLPAKL